MTFEVKLLYDLFPLNAFLLTLSNTRLAICSTVVLVRDKLLE